MELDGTGASLAIAMAASALLLVIIPGNIVDNYSCDTTCCIRLVLIVTYSLPRVSLISGSRSGSDNLWAMAASCVMVALMPLIVQLKLSYRRLKTVVISCILHPWCMEYASIAVSSNMIPVLVKQL